jgi:hypothetical protein
LIELVEDRPMKCPLCEERKGKRLCKVNAGQFICLLCCAAVRGAGCEGCRHFEPCLAYQREKELVKTSAGKHFTVEILEAVDGEKGSAGRLAKKKLDELEALIQKTSGIRLSNYSDIISAKKPRLSR